MADIEGSVVRAPSRFNWWNIVAGIVFGIAAVIAAPLIGLFISSELDNTGGHPTWLTLFLGVFALGVLFWWLLMSLPVRFSALRGGVVGILVAFFSYPVVIALSELVYRDWQNLPPLMQRLESVLLVTALTLMTTGISAVTTLAVVGWLTALVYLRLHPEAASGADRQRLSPVVAAVAAAIIFAALAGAFAWFSTRPLATVDLAEIPVTPQPTATYEEAIAAFQAIEAEEAKLQLGELCHSKLLTHGAKVARVVIYFHGFTSCPAQGDRLAETLFEMGYNVYLPRLFAHGLASPSADTMAELTAQHLIDLANQSVDIAGGLGDEVVVTGLSAGGTMAGWTAQFRADVDHAMLISPFFGPYVVPPWATRAATNLVLRLPDVSFAWNPLQNEGEAAGIPVALPTTHALAEIMLVGWLVQDAARTTPPLAGRISVLLNDADVAVTNALTQQVVADWRAQGATVDVVTLPFRHLLPHDMINHRERGSDVELVHSTLIEMMNAP